MSARPMRLELYRRPYTEIVFDEDGPTGTRLAWKWRWRIRAGNGRILADSAEAYGRLRDCAHGAGLVTGVTGRGVLSVRLGTTADRCDGEGRVWRITVES